MSSTVRAIVLRKDSTTDPAELGLSIPSFRERQLETIQAIANSPKKVTLIEGPPGAGKSAIAVGAARYMGAKKAVVLTHTLQLQDQYIESIPGLVAVKGRKNFECAIQRGITADEAPCTVCGPRECPEYYGRCQYYNQLRTALSSPLTVLNYAFWFRAAIGGMFSNLDLLICDEAHLLLGGDNPIAQAMEVQLFKPTLRAIGLDLPDYSDTDYQSWRSWARRTMDLLAPDVGLAHDFGKMSRTEIRRANAIKSTHEKCSRLSSLDDDWLVRRDTLGVTFGPVWVRDYADDYLFRHARKIVLLSATILSASHFVDGLGLEASDVDFFQLPSTFPAARRPLHVRPVAKVDKKMGLEDAAALVAAVDAILERHPGEKGLVHTANYDLARLVRDSSRHQERLITHGSADRLTQVEAFRRSSEPLVMLSPSLHTGLDLPDDQLRFQIVLKIPYPNLGDERIKKRMKTGPDGFPNPRGKAWYAWQTLCTLIQAYGRVMRSERDWGKTYIVDAHMKRLYGETKALIPGWVKEAMIWEVPTERFKEELDGELDD